ncbi:MAG: MgtC/SapB family protein [Lachnospiraceae bacterium]|nr:MgtC/SapB family protein [Lachnospiraceae bacterium]
MTLEEFAIRLLIVALIGFIIGVERQLTGHSAGLKPTVIIAIGTMVFVSVEIAIGRNDVRMAANIITGIGFLCSGVIFKNGLTVNGLSTSATLWSTAAISVLVSYGFEIYALVATGILLFFNLLIPFASKLFKPIKFFTDASSDDTFYINVVCLKGDVSKVKEIIMNSIDDKLKLDSVQASSITEDKFRVKAKLGSSHSRIDDIAAITDEIFESGVLSVTWEKSEE